MSKEVFKQNPDLKEVFITSDNTPFFTRNLAENHAKTLADRNIKRVVNPSLSEVPTVDMDDANNAPLGLIQTGETEKGDPDLKQIVAQVQTDGAVDLTVVAVNDADVTNTGNVIEPAKVEAPAIEPEKVEATKLTAKQQLQKDYQDKFKEIPAEHFTKAELLKAFNTGEKLEAVIENKENK